MHAATFDGQRGLTPAIRSRELQPPHAERTLAALQEDHRVTFPRPDEIDRPLERVIFATVLGFRAAILRPEDEWLATSGYDVCQKPGFHFPKQSLEEQYDKYKVR